MEVPMPRRMLAVTALLVGGLACRDSPTAAAGALLDQPAGPAVTPEALATIHDVVDDRFVLELVAGVDEPGSRQVSRVLRAVSDAAAAGMPWAMLDSTLAAAQHVVQREDVVDDAVVRTAFGLVLDYADGALDHGRVDDTRGDTR
jgi:hypothetical protein